MIVSIDGRDVRGLTAGGAGRLIGTDDVGEALRVGVIRGAVARTFEVAVEGPWRW